jgi:SAM-dependent methyltransferase
MMNDEQVWQRFLAWITTAPTFDGPFAVLGAYVKDLTAAGLTEEEMARHRAVIQGRMRSGDEGWQVIFNKIYSSKTPGFNLQPNQTMADAVAGRSPGQALDAGMGQGRNAIYLAMNGWDVTGFDLSDAGVELVRRNAESAGVRLTALQASEREFDYGESRWDLIVFSYVPFDVTDERYVERLHRSLRPGGLAVVESFASDASVRGRRPVDIDPEALLWAFRAFHVTRFEDVVTMPDWTKEEARVVRMIAEKP